MQSHIEALGVRVVRWSVVCAVLGGWGAAVAAADPPESGGTNEPPRQHLTLAAAIRIALEHNPELHGWARRAEAAAGRADQAPRWSNPELTLSVEDWAVDGAGGFEEAKHLVGLAQTIPFPGKKRLDRQIGITGVRLSDAELDLRRLELVHEVKAAFFQVQAAGQRVEVGRELVRVAQTSAATARRRVEAGAAADPEHLRAEILLEQARAGVADDERAWVTARQTLAGLLGRPDLGDTPLAGSLAEAPDVQVLEQGPERWLARHPLVVVAHRARERAELAWRRSRLDPYPDVRMGLGGGRVGETERSIIEVGVAVPLPILDRSKGRQREAKAEAQVAQAHQEATELRLRRDWSIARQRLRSAAEQVTRHRERILPKADEALRLVQIGFEQGKLDVIDLLDIQRTTAEARLAYQRALLELNLAQAALEALIPPATAASPTP